MPSPARPTVIVNADDFGLAPCVNRGIVRAHREGLVTSATLLANGPAFDDAVALAKACPGLGVGVHLNLVRGRPVLTARRLPGLVDADGRFEPARLFRAAGTVGGRQATGWLGMLEPAAEAPLLMPWARETVAGEPPPFPEPHGPADIPVRGLLTLQGPEGPFSLLAQAAAEYRAQIVKVAAAGIRPTHVDFEQHHGRRPALYIIARAAARAAGIPAMRRYREPCWWVWRRMGWPPPGRMLRAALLRTHETLFRPDLEYHDEVYYTKPGATGGAPRLPAGLGLPLRLARYLLGAGRDDPYRSAMGYPDHFLGQSHIGAMDTAVWLRLLNKPDWPSGVTEIMVHPGEYDPDEIARFEPDLGASWIHPRRPAELAALTDPTVVARWREAVRPDGPLRAAHFGCFA